MSNSRALETDKLASIAADGSRLISRRAVVVHFAAACLHALRDSSSLSKRAELARLIGVGQARFDTGERSPLGVLGRTPLRGGRPYPGSRPCTTSPSTKSGTTS